VRGTSRAGYSLKVPQLVSVQEGLCVLVPCSFTYPASFDTDNPSAQLFRNWYKDQVDVHWDLPVASSDPSRGVSQETQSRFQLTGDLTHGNCSLQISDAQRMDAGRYFLRVEKGDFKYSYRSNYYHTHPTLQILVPELTEEPEIQITPAWEPPGTLLAGEPVTVTCTAPGRCSLTPPRVAWMGPFSDTARNVSAPLANGTWAHSSALSFTPAPGDHGKELICNVTYSSAQGPSTRRTIRLHIVPDVWGAEGDIVSLETQEGDSLTLRCEAGSRTESTLSWAKGNESLSPGQGGAGHLELSNLSRGDAGEYWCWAKNSYGSANRALHVHMQCKALGVAVPEGVGRGVSGACYAAGGRAGSPCPVLLGVGWRVSGGHCAGGRGETDRAELILPIPVAQRQLQLLPSLPPPTPAPVAGGRGAPGCEGLMGGPAGQLLDPEA
uniref:Ig-like domain-containing protein n=1 Tax=Terrapene triunguis TaxID=2587831 RepID=A0A674JFU1_9SAUR